MDYRKLVCASSFSTPPPSVRHSPFHKNTSHLERSGHGMAAVSSSASKTRGRGIAPIHLRQFALQDPNCSARSPDLWCRVGQHVLFHFHETVEVVENINVTISRPPSTVSKDTIRHFPTPEEVNRLRIPVCDLLRSGPRHLKSKNESQGYTRIGNSGKLASTFLPVGQLDQGQHRETFSANPKVLNPSFWKIDLAFRVEILCLKREDLPAAKIAERLLAPWVGAVRYHRPDLLVRSMDCFRTRTQMIPLLLDDERVSLELVLGRMIFTGALCSTELALQTVVHTCQRVSY